MPARINATLAELEAATASFSRGSEFYDRANLTLVELTAALHNVRALARTLDEAPNSLIFSSSRGPDPEPKVTSQ
jgi:paraquat-inducible protein B